MNVLAIGCHPDDIEIGAGATAAKLAANAPKRPGKVSAQKRIRIRGSAYFSRRAFCFALSMGLSR